MKKENKSLLLVGAGVMLAIILVFLLFEHGKNKRVLPYYIVIPAQSKIMEVEQPGKQVGPFSFTDQKNRKVTEKDTKGKVFVVDYFFAQCPGICKIMSSELKKVYDKYEYQKNFLILSCTSKPEEDSVSALMNYALRQGVSDHDRWRFLTGSKKELYRVAREEYLIVNDEGDGGEDDFIHTEQMVLFDKKGYIRGYYDGTDSSDVKRLITDIDVLLQQ